MGSEIEREKAGVVAAVSFAVCALIVLASLLANAVAIAWR